MNPNEIQVGKEYKGRTPYTRYVLYIGSTEPKSSMIPIH